MLRKVEGSSGLAPDGRPEGPVTRAEARPQLRNFWQCAGGFWGVRAKEAPWLLAGLLLIIVLLSLAASYGMNLWNRVIFDALQTRDSGTVLELSMLYVPLLVGSVFLGVAQLGARMTIQRRWRKWLNKLLSDRWLKNGHYYQLNLVAGGHQNPSVASPTTSGSPPRRRLNSPPARPQRFCRQ
jgi:vitamin B12/bleomycin/antimicrobial peptide transport system ATP-binding/permease protein